MTGALPSSANSRSGRSLCRARCHGAIGGQGPHASGSPVLAGITTSHRVAGGSQVFASDKATGGEDGPARRPDVRSAEQAAAGSEARVNHPAGTPPGALPADPAAPAAPSLLKVSPGRGDARHGSAPLRMLNRAPASATASTTATRGWWAAAALMGLLVAAWAGGRWWPDPAVAPVVRSDAPPAAGASRPVAPNVAAPPVSVTARAAPAPVIAAAAHAAVEPVDRPATTAAVTAAALQAAEAEQAPAEPRRAPALHVRPVQAGKAAAAVVRGPAQAAPAKKARQVKQPGPARGAPRQLAASRSGTAPLNVPGERSLPAGRPHPAPHQGQQQAGGSSDPDAELIGALMSHLHRRPPAASGGPSLPQPVPPTPAVSKKL